MSHGVMVLGVCHMVNYLPTSLRIYRCYDTSTDEGLCVEDRWSAGQLQTICNTLSDNRGHSLGLLHYLIHWLVFHVSFQVTPHIFPLSSLYVVHCTIYLMSYLLINIIPTCHTYTFSVFLQEIKETTGLVQDL